jgi:hypothetical protein
VFADLFLSLAVAAFGFIYLGGIQYALYVPIFGRMFPQAAAFAAKSVRDKLKDTRGMFNVAAQVFIDQCIHHPLMYFPAFYMTKELVLSDKPDVSRALALCRKNMAEDLPALWKIWVPSTAFNFAFMPMHMRIPWVATTSLLWTMILSSMRGGDIVHGDELIGGAVTGAAMDLFEESVEEIFTPTVQELDRGKSHIMVTATGNAHNARWVSLLSRAVANEGGNITHSKMVRLGQEFIIQMHVSVSPGQAKNLVKALGRHSDLKGLSINCNSLNRRPTGTYDLATMGVNVRCIGSDRYVLSMTLHILYHDGRDLSTYL